MSDKEELEALLLQRLNDLSSELDSLEFVTSLNRVDEHQTLVGILKSLDASAVVTTKPVKHSKWVLTEEGEESLIQGSPAARLFAAIPPEDGADMAALQAQFGDIFRPAQGTCMKNKWIRVDKAAGKLVRNVDSIVDEVPAQLRSVQAGEVLDKKVMDGLKRGKAVVTQSYTTYLVGKGEKFTLQRKKLATDLTADMIQNWTWEQEEFKEYNFQTEGVDLKPGCIHPLMKVRREFRSILLEMGFEEMPTNNFVESSFWNFDSLFQPQQHPARDSHDTFFLSDPTSCLTVPDAYKDRVQSMHERGGFGSIGYRYDWSFDEAKKNILRTHTTAVSSRMLYKLAQQKPFTPSKYFSIDRVFRNETLDSTHLCEFHQVEGLVADYDLTLGDLIGVIKLFFSRIGIDDVRFKPAYNPYTEPSMEIFGFSRQLGKWIEVGNSGVFRPEMLRPMGLPENVRVIAWGLGLERPTMIKYGIEKIQELFGHKMRMDKITDNPIARYNMESKPSDTI